MRKCPVCLKEIPETIRKDSVYCSDDCRKRMYELRSGRRWDNKCRMWVKKDEMVQ